MQITGAHPYFKKLAPKLTARETGVGPWDIADLCKAYQWPTELAGGGVIAIIELGGGWTAIDMQAFCAANGVPMPSITDISVDGTKNTPGGDADGEVALDLQVALVSYFVATDKAPTMRVYWCQDIATGVRAATADGCDVCSISWGADEANWGEEAAKDMDTAAAAATAAGMIVFAASGDNDSSDGGPSAANVDCPASCPNVIGCGGTSKYQTAEVVWNNSPGNAEGSGSGGGYSTVFAMPDWQSKNGAPSGPGRMVPDVAANADPNTGYKIFYAGAPQIVGGTSAVAPLYAGLFAAFGNKLGVALVSKLWANRPCFTDITQGDNGMYRATTGPDPCTGMGVPIGTKLDALFPLITTEPAPAPLPLAPPPVLSLPNAISWACSQLPSMFMTKGTAEKHITAGLTKSWPAGAVGPSAAIKFFDEHYRLLADQAALAREHASLQAHMKVLIQRLQTTDLAMRDMNAEAEKLAQESASKLEQLSNAHAGDRQAMIDQHAGELAGSAQVLDAAHAEIASWKDLYEKLLTERAERQQAHTSELQALRETHASELAGLDQTHAASVQALHEAHAAELAEAARMLADAESRVAALKETLMNLVEVGPPASGEPPASEE